MQLLPKLRRHIFHLSLVLRPVLRKWQKQSWKAANALAILLTGPVGRSLKLASKTWQLLLCLMLAKPRGLISSTLKKHCHLPPIFLLGKLWRDGMKTSSRRGHLARQPQHQRCACSSKAATHFHESGHVKEQPA